MKNTLSPHDNRSFPFAGELWLGSNRGQRQWFWYSEGGYSVCGKAALHVQDRTDG